MGSHSSVPNLTPPLSPNESKAHGRRAWKAYFWVALIADLSLATFAFAFPEIYDTTEITYIDFMVSAVAMIGMFGFSYRKRIARRSFWKAQFPIILSWDLYAAGGDWTVWDSFSEFSPTIAIYLTLGLPLYIALYRYAFKEDETWNPTGAAKAHGAI